MSSLLSGCSLSAAQPPVAEQRADLLDNDNDGVINARDTCPATPKDAVIDNNGCPELLEVVARDDLHILFANNSVKIPSSFLSEVDDLANFMKTFPQTKVELKGYASPVGSVELNQALSQLRAEVVKKALVRKRIAPSRITILALGESEPVVTPSKKQTEVLSRRVTASVVSSQTSVIQEWTIYTSS
ncbi:OmpA family protein [Enterovibrio sp. 27052020O]|uniref:OmpA family protein n=1 Tax=Enterovibrio sp. 27052020O TaxID=3241166 RepID=UPI0038903826